jgi:hypothetical protein
MRASGLLAGIVFVPVAAIVAGSALAADRFEGPANFDAAKIPGIRASGTNYAILNPVRSDGFLRVYALKTPYGEFAVNGDAVMQMRMIELAAVNELDRVNNSEAFNKALVEAGLKPIKYAGELIVNPVKTIGGTLAGIGSAFGQFGSGISNAGKTPDDPMAGLLGVSKKKRELAAKLGVDPYTDFEPLAVKLTKLSEAAAMGGLAVNGALMAIPGVAGIVVTNVSTSSDLNSISRDYTAAQIMDMMRPKLAAMGTPRDVAEAFIHNRNYTPLDALAVVDALEAIQADGRGAFVARAAAVNRRDAAFFMRRHVELLAAFNRKGAPIASFTALGEFPFVRLRSGAVLGLWPVDALSWTESTAAAMRAVEGDRKRHGIGSAELRITGQATALARQNMKAMGWTLTENARP